MMNDKRVLSAVLTAIMVLSIATSMVASTDDGGCSMDPTPEVRFTNDPLGNRIDDVLADGKSVFLFFYADWCPYCHQETPIIDQLEEEYAGEVTFIRINVTARPDHAKEFEVSALPTMVAISGKNGEGYVKEEITGFTEETRLRGIIDLWTGYESSDAGDSTDANPLQAEIGNDIVDDVTAAARQPVHSFKPTAVAAASPIIAWEYDQIQPAVAYNSQTDEHLVVWEDHHWGWGNDWDIYGRRVSADGVTLGNHFAISWEGDKHRLAPDMAYNDANGEFLVVWEYEHSSDDHDIYARRVASNGTLIGGELAIATLTKFESNPVVAYNSADEEYMIVWEHLAGSDEFTHNNIYGQRVNADGTLLSDPIVIASDSLDESAPAVAYGGNGKYMVAWQDKQHGTTRAYNIRGYLVGGDGSLLSSEITIATWEYDLVKPRLAFNDRANEFLVVWEDHRWGWGEDWNIYGQRVNADGVLAGDNFGISWEGVNHYVSPDVAYDPAANEYMVVWEYEYSVSDHDVYRRRVGSDGTLLEEEIGVSTQGSQECMPALASGGDRSYLIVWGDGRDAETQGMDIYGSIVRPQMLSGRVYEGEVGDESTPLGGVTVELYCSNDADDRGTLIASTTTDSEGWYGLLVSGVCEFYNILETDPTGYTSVVATSVDGTVVTDNWIQYEYPLDGKTLTGNKFWDRSPATVECYSCADCSAKLNGNYPVVILQNNITGASRCIKFNSNNTTFDGQGFTIEWEGVNPEFSYGIQMAGRTGNTIQNCRITDFETGISLRSSDDNNLINNTLFSNLGAGIWLCDSDNNNLINATLFSNRYGIRLLNSHHNNISGNNITQNQNGVGLSSSNFNSFVNNTICKQKEQDIYAFDATSSNTRSGNKCDKIYNWNSDNAYTCCDQVCTADQATTCSSGSELKDALKGDFNYVKFANNLYVPGGIAIDASHVTLDCNGYTISGNGESAGFLLDNLINVTIKDCTIQGFETGIAMPSSSLNNIHDNHIQNNGRGISLFKTSQVKPQGNSIFSNDLRYNRIYGISLSDAEKNYIHTNTVLDSSLYSIWVSGTCDNNITNNYGGDLNNPNPILYWHDKAVGGSVPAGTYSEIIFCNVSHSTIENVDIDNGNTKNDGILLINSKTTHIKNNLINSTNGVSSINSDDISIYDNDVTFSKSDGISMDHSEDSRIYNNTIENNNRSGILVTVVSNNADIFNNTIKKNYRGIEIRYSDDVKISDNTIHQNTEEGIEIKDSIRTDIFKNDILGNKFGLFFDHHTTQSNARENYICYNSVSDIFDESFDGYRFLNTGDDNTCSFHLWKDSSISEGCSKDCTGWYQFNYGFSFRNPSGTTLSYGDCWSGDDCCRTGYGNYKETFGNCEVCICFDLPWDWGWCSGWWPHAGGYYPIYRWLGASQGQCTGMSLSSLLFYNSDESVQSYNSSVTAVKNLAHQGKLKDHIAAMQGKVVSGAMIDHYLFSPSYWGANDVLSRAKSDLAKDPHNHGMISIMEEVSWEFPKGHTVVVDSIEETVGTAKIYVYDSNKESLTTKNMFTNPSLIGKNIYPYISINKKSDSYSFKTASGEIWSDVDGETFDRLGYLPYSKFKGDVDIPWEFIALIGILAVLGDTDAQVEDTEGRILGFSENGTGIAEIPNATILPIYGNYGKGKHQMPMLYALPSGDYKMNVTGHANGNYSSYMLGSSSMFVVHDVEVNENTKDIFSVHHPLDIISMETSDAEKPYSVEIIRGIGQGENASERVFKVKNATIYNDSRAVFKISPNSTYLIYTNRGNKTINYSVEFQSTEIPEEDRESVFYNQRLPAAYRDDVVIQPMETHILTPGDWLNLNESRIDLSVEKCGDGVCRFGEDDYNCPEDCEKPTCVTPSDDLYINSDTILCPGVYNIPDSGAEGAIIINASDIVLDCNGATINGTMTGSDCGIYSRGFDNVTIKNCNVMDYHAGIELEMSSNSTITDNDLSSNRYGIYLFSSDDSTVTNNNANSNRYKGIGLADSSNNLVTNNNANENEDGIFLGPVSSNNRIEGNSASSNRQAGIYIYGNSSSNNFSNNKINNNLYGIYLGPCICPTCSHYCPGGNFNNRIRANEILNNEIGIFSNQSSSMIDSNMICNNIELDFNSSNWLLSSGDNNTCNKPGGWNDSETTGCTYSCPSSKGDLNDDGKITTADAAIALQLAASGEWRAEADVDCDGRVTALDALMIVQAAAGNIELEGCES